LGRIAGEEAAQILLDLVQIAGSCTNFTLSNGK